MAVVSTRISDDVAKVFHDAGLSPGTLARELLEREARAILVRRKLERLKARRFTPDEPVLTTIRRIRDEG